MFTNTKILNILISIILLKKNIIMIYVLPLYVIYTDIFYSFT